MAWLCIETEAALQVNGESFIESSSANQIIASIYFVSTTITSVGYGEFHGCECVGPVDVWKLDACQALALLPLALCTNQGTSSPKRKASVLWLFSSSSVVQYSCRT